jgi:hypothetical protein
MEPQGKTWIDWLAEDDLAFIRRFVLASGSLKALAQSYGVTYPTIRLRLDRLIQKIQVIEDHQNASHFERSLGAMFADGRFSADTLKQILQAHRQEMEDHA